MYERGPALKQHDVTDLIGLHVIVVNTAHEVIDEDGEVSIEIPDIKVLSAASAIGRCMSPLRLQGAELRAIRRIVGWTAADLALKLGEKTSAETISRWENDKQLMGGYAEKVFRLVVCEELAKDAPGVAYHAGIIARLVVYDPWRSNAEFVVPPLVFERVKMRGADRQILETWEMELAA